MTPRHPSCVIRCDLRTHKTQKISTIQPPRDVNSQVHRARLLDGTEVAMKIQYPGVANSVESDLSNLQLLVKLTNILPQGLYIDEIIKVS